MPPSHTSASPKRLGPSTRPPLWFTMAFQHHVNDDVVGRYNDTLENVVRSNVVMHSTTKRTPRQRVLMRALGKRWNETARGSLVTALRSNNMASPFAHFRFQTLNDGKLLSFTTGNTIRAGKHTHGDSVLAALRFQWYLYKTTDGHQPPWISACSTPNTVLTGRLKGGINERFTKEWTVTSTSKFPGCAVTIPNCPGVTPEVFPSSGKFIVPGVTSVKTLQSALDHLKYLQHQNTFKP